MTSVVLAFFLVLFHCTGSYGLQAGGNHQAEYDGLVWFLQISDIHISTMDDPGRIDDFRVFAGKYLEIYDPALVLCTGDLTDSKTNGGLGSSPVEEEWMVYHDIVTNRSRSVPWLDIRGNHDNMNVLSRASSNNLFSKYSVMGPQGNLESYKFSTRFGEQQYNFVGLDATLEKGMRFPFNFVGDIPPEQQKIIRNITAGLDLGDINIFFGHYPSSVIRQQEFVLSVVSGGLVYLCGHLHDLAIFRMHDMYSLHGGDNLELELCDWKSNRAYRLLAVDQGFISFTDQRFGDWPVILPTLPKNSEFLLGSQEPKFEDQSINSIRILVFSDTTIIAVNVRLNEGDEMVAVRVGDGPLYTVPWNPQEYRTGRHDLTVSARDAANRTKTIKQPFALEKSAANQFSRFFPNLVLNSSFSSLFQALFWISLVIHASILPLAKLCIILYIRRRLPLCLSRVIRGLGRCCVIRKLFYVSSIRVLCLSFSLFPVYLAAGPWIFASIIEEDIGAMFAWGAIVNGTFVPAQVGYFLYFVHFLTSHPAAVLSCGHILQTRAAHPGVRGYKRVVDACTILMLLVGLIFLVMLSLIIWIQFKALGFFFSPLYTWSYIFYGLMVFLSCRIDISTIKTGLFEEDSRKKYDDKTEDEELEHLSQLTGQNTTPATRIV